MRPSSPRILLIVIPAPIPQHAPTAKILKTALPTMVPTPMSPFVTKVPMTLVKSSGALVLIAMNVAPAVAGCIFSSTSLKQQHIKDLKKRKSSLLLFGNKKKTLRKEILLESTFQQS